MNTKRHKHADLIHAWAADYATLKYPQELKRIREVQVPEEPEEVASVIDGNWSANSALRTRQYIDTLRDLLKKESARADYNGEQWAASAEAILVVNKRADAAEATIKATFAKLIERAGVKK